MLMRYHSEGVKAIHDDPTEAFARMNEAIERWEAKIVGSYRLLGEWDQCTIVEAPDNFKAYRASLEQEISTSAETQILPAINYELFSTPSSSGTPKRSQFGTSLRRILAPPSGCCLNFST